MAPACPLALTSFFCCILLLQTICCSGVFVELSYDSTQVKALSSSVITEYRVMVTDKHRAYVFLKPFVCRETPCRSEHLAATGKFVNEVLGPNRRFNVTSIIVTAKDTQLGALRRTLQSFHASLGPAGLAASVKVSPEFSLSSLRIVAKDRDRARKKQWSKVVEFVRRTGSFVLVLVDTEAEARSQLAVDAEIEQAAAEVAALLGAGADSGVFVLHVKSRVAPSAVVMVKLGVDTGRRKRLLGVLADMTSPRRELGEARMTAHDEFSPVSNPVTTPVSNPVTVPATNPVANPMAPGFVTVPSTNPGNGFSTNPNMPPLYPEPTTPATMPMPDPTTTTTPVTVPPPFANPVAAPTTMPGTVTNPATTPSFSGTSPVTNPVTTSPGGVGGGMPATQPVYQAPATTMPGTGTGTGTGTVQPGAPTMAGQAWCVAKSGLTDTTLQDAMDYACGMGGADCSAIQPMGACYNPNTLQAHASYAFNSYFQRNPSAASCDFGGAGMLINVNPSSGTCMYQTSSGSSAGFSPGTTGGGVPSGYTPGMSGTGYNPTGGMSGTMGGGSGSTVLNANGNSMYGGYENPSGLTAGSAPLSCGGWVVLCLVWMVTFAFVKEKL